MTTFGNKNMLRESTFKQVPVYKEADMGYKKEDIPLYEEEEYRPYREEKDEEEYRTYGQEEEGEYRTSFEEEEGEYGHYGEEEEMEGYGSNTVQEEVDYHSYRFGSWHVYVCVQAPSCREREEARAGDLHNYYKQLRGQTGGTG